VFLWVAMTDNIIRVFRVQEEAIHSSIIIIIIIIHIITGTTALTGATRR
jgi:hypothetical protein